MIVGPGVHNLTAEETARRVPLTHTPETVVDAAARAAFGEFAQLNFPEEP